MFNRGNGNGRNNQLQLYVTHTDSKLLMYEWLKRWKNSTSEYLQQ